MSAAMSLRGFLLAPLYSLAIGLCAGAAGVLLGLWLCGLGFDWGLIKANAAIDDDAMIITTGFAYAGGLTGFLAGAISGWRVIAKGRG